MAKQAAAINALLFLYTETSLHAGTGSTVSVVDLPIQRERTTQYPTVAGSGLKGALRSQYFGEGAEAIFGPETTNADAYAGAVSVGDARIVLFPVQALAGVFAFATSAHALSRLKRDADDFPVLSAAPEAGKALITSRSNLVAGSKVVLEEFSFEPVKSAEVDKIAAWLAENALPGGDEYAYWRNKLAQSLVILPEDDFRDFCRNSTEISTRVRLEPGTKTVAKGALWTEESLPSDCLLYTPVRVGAARNGNGWSEAVVMQQLEDGIAPRIQLGGDETTGSGFVAVRWR